MKRLTIFVLLAAVAVSTWFFVSPLFIDRTVDEQFEFQLENGGIDLETIMSMPAAKRQEMQQDIMDAATDAPDQLSAEDMPTGLPQVIGRGQFVDADSIHKGSGQATLYALPDGSHAIRFEDFRTTNGPALVVYLAKHPSPTQAADVIDNGYVSLGKLKGNVGNQNYAVPAGTDIAEYNSVVLWCELFDVLFSPAALSRT